MSFGEILDLTVVYLSVPVLLRGRFDTFTYVRVVHRGHVYWR